LTSFGSVTIRRASPAHADGCGRFIHAAFGAVNERRGYRSRWPTPAFAARFAAQFIANPRIYAIVAEVDGEVIGCNFRDDRGPVRGIGPTAVSPSAQRNGIGRALMQAALDRNRQPVRLLQDSFNTASLALYAFLGFEVKEPVALGSGNPRGAPSGASAVRPMRDDLARCGQLCRRVHGFDRNCELEDAIREPGPTPLCSSAMTRSARTAPGSEPSHTPWRKQSAR
jgi:GNAT superfamily N-acetyltransferase